MCNITASLAKISKAYLIEELQCCVRHTSSTGHFGCALFMSARGKKEGVTEDKEEVKENKPRLQSARSHDQMSHARIVHVPVL